MSIGGGALFSTRRAQVPDWWLERGLVSTNAPVATNDFAPGNLGQLKHAAWVAAQELEAALPGGAGGNVLAMVAAWTNGTAGADDYAPLNLGQLKATAKPFYDRIIASGGWTNGYPWTTNTVADDEDFAPANLGQLKYAFAFDSASFDTDSDGMADWWENQIIDAAQNDADPSNDHIQAIGDVMPNQDFDLDGITNVEEWQTGGDPIDQADAGSSVLYVDDNVAGSGTGTYADPYPTIQAAIDAAPAGFAQKRVIVLPGTYCGAGNTNLTFGSKALVVRGMGDADQVIIDCGQSGRAFHFAGDVTNSAIQGVTIRGGASGGEDGAAVLFEASVGGFAIENCVFDGCDAGEGNGGAIALAGGSGVDLHVTRSLFVRNRAAQGAAVCLAPYTNFAVLIENCRIEENSSEGGIITLADASPTQTSIRIVNNTFINNAAPAGTLVVGAGTAPGVANNIIAHNSAGIVEADGGGAGYKHNCVYNPVGADYTGPGEPLAENENILVDPKIVSKQYSQTMLNPDSPCIDAGDPISTESNTDYAGEPRIQIASVDIGAYERVDGAPPPSGPTRIYVATDGNDSNGGGTWTTAKLTLQAAVNEIATHPDGIEIWIKAGTYEQNVNISEGRIGIYGGFLGNELALDERKIEQNPTIFDGQGSGVIFNVCVGVGANGPTIDGVEFRNAHKAMVVSGGSAVLKRCKVYRCVDPSSAQNPRVDLFAIEVVNAGHDRWHASGLGSVAEVYDCDISDNDVGGIFVGADCTAHVQDTRIAGNCGIYGAGICAQGRNAYIRVERCLIDGNAATFCGGGIFVEEGACAITNTRIVRNHVDRSVKSHIPELPNGNWGVGDLSLVVAAGGYCGGGIAFHGDSTKVQYGPQPPAPYMWPERHRNVSSVDHCTIADNVANKGGGIFGDQIFPGTDIDGWQWRYFYPVEELPEDMKLTVWNSILWGNESSDGIQIAAKDFVFTHACCVQGGGGDIAGDPTLTRNEYRLAVGSSCINAGTYGCGYSRLQRHGTAAGSYDWWDWRRDMDGEERPYWPDFPIWRLRCDVGSDEFVDTEMVWEDRDGDGFIDEGDGLADVWEMQIVNHDPNDVFGSIADVLPTGDFDQDGLLDVDEYRYGADPRTPDTDGDKILDAYEVANDLNPAAPDDPFSDPDGDLLVLIQEQAFGTSERDTDADDDGWSDYYEYFSGTDPHVRDSDSDGTEDFDEDCDGDGLTNQIEVVSHHTDPLDTDTDLDGLSDPEEVSRGLNPLDHNDAGIDADGDGLTTTTEIRLGCDPTRPDTDGDGIVDGVEVAVGLNPLLQDSDGDLTPDILEDTDGDGLTNEQELTLGTDMGDPDTDDDGIPDGSDPDPLTP
ncbi:MAG: right-handed parallel beta-helix repeat-containing protein [Verrucomicrobiae bacterium]|nr:right-handed parallel beta-helix repeat-containing protein [Verrucomicrobiae bacterium]